MKKIIAILLISLSTLYAVPFARKCKICQKPTNPSVTIGIAYRSFETPIVYKNGKSYATYKCCYGHSFLIELPGDKNERN